MTSTFIFVALGVRIPMMPKGVEHLTVPEIVDPLLGGENSDDAERR